MRADPSREDRLRRELAALVARAPGEPGPRDDLFAALSRLEKRALIGGGSDEILKTIAEVRFLAGILRDAVRPVRAAGPRAVRRLVRAGERVGPT